MQSVAFGSCNRQSLPQDHWARIHALVRPQAFLWTGDAVYAKDNSLAALDRAYINLTSSSEYAAFAANLSLIDGVYDDHDYGVNDGGSSVALKPERKERYVRFLEASNPHPLSQHLDAVRALRAHEGLYHSIDIRLQAGAAGDAESAVVKVIFLDTRTFRSDHIVRSLGELKLPLTPLLAAAVRAGYTMLLGYGRDYGGDVLGEEQARWLDETLATSTADFHVVVSSIQLLTVNPVVESWGHFPRAKAALLQTMKHCDPRGLLFLSGDVHHAELSSLDFTRSNSREPVYEFTSSGLTHSCGSTLCPLMLGVFRQHRVPRDKHLNHSLSSGNVYSGRNFGSIRLVSRGELNVRIFSLQDGEPVLEQSVRSAGERAQAGLADPVLSVTYYDLPVLSTVDVVWILWAASLAALLVALLAAKVRRGMCGK